MTDRHRMTIEMAGGLARLLLDRERKRNAIDEAFIDAFEAAIERVAEDRSVRVLLIEGAGPAFCAGFDLGVLDDIEDAKERKQRFAPLIRERLRRMSRVLDRLAGMEPVSIAAVQGAAAGGGFSIALACDLRIVAHDARCWFPEVELGSPLSPASTRLLARQVPAGVAKDIVLGCRRLDARALLALGIANRVTNAATLGDDARAYAVELLAMPASALLIAKATVNAVVAGHSVVRPDLIADRD